jgi:hypothetical protein
LIAVALLALAGCHGDSASDGATPGEAQELNQAAASIDINATSASNDGEQAQ